METGKPGLASAPVHINSSAAQTEKRMDIQAPPLMAVYIPTVSALPVQPYSQPPAPAREAATLHLAVPPLYSMETLPFLTLHIAGGLQSQAGLSLAAVSPSARTKSTGKHVCPHCGRDCMKPSVLEKHLRCHTGERPYPCTTCGISFKTQSNLYKHKRTQAHARLSSESDQSCQGSLDSMSSSRETCTFSLSLEESGRMEDDTTPPAPESTSPARTAKVSSAQMHGSVSEQNELNPADCQAKETNDRTEVTAEGEKERMENKKILQNASRHLPLQRQEATLFSKQWESSASRGKSQSHESTDSGFSESSDHHPSPGSILLDHSMDSLAESTKEHLEETADTQTSSERGHDAQETTQVARKQEQKTLEERISKLISENSAVVEDKQLENVRPRKTALSKQGSIDLPLPYTYKDSFHFDMRISQTQNVGLQRNRMAGFYSSVPTQHSTTSEHAPLLRSNSLPFSVALLQPERSTPTSSIQSDYLTLIRSKSSGQINPTGFTSKSVNQQPPTHHPLVRQIAVDCNHATDSLYSSSMEEACTASLSCDRDNSDNGGEPSNRKCRRKKSQKFAYNKWYMYRGGTFKKLYGAENGANNSVIKGKKCSTNPDPEVVQGSQKRQSEVHKETVMTARSAVTFMSSSSAKVCHPECPPAKLSHVPAADFNPKTGHLPTSLSSLAPLGRNLSSSVLPLPPTGSLVNYKTGSLSRAEVKEKHSDSGSQLCRSHIPSDRKKQKTDDEPIFPLETDPNTQTHAPPSATGGAPQQALNPSYVNLRDELKHAQLKGVLFPPSISNENTTPVSISPAASTPSAAKKSFLPKYQLKLPNAAEPASNASPQVAGKATVTGCCDVSALSSCNIEQTPVKTVVFSSTQTQLSLACTAAALCQAESLSLNHNPKSSLAAHRQLATATITTTCRRDHQAGLCSSSKKPSKSTGVSIAVANFPAAPAVTTANHQTSAAAITAFSPGQTDHPLPHARLLPASDQSGLIGSNIATVPCQIVPFDQTLTPAQNVFHVHTADLQICLQIISDEQLALIEPQIERPAGSAPSQRRDTEAAVPEAIQKSAQSSGTTGIHSEVEDRRHSAHQKELDQREPLVTLNAERVRPQRPEQVGEAELNPPLTEQGTFPQARVSADSGPPETQGLTRRPHNYVNVNTVTDTQNKTTEVLPTLASHIIEPSGRSPTSAERLVPSLNRCAEVQPYSESRVSQGGSVSPTLCGQHKLDTTCLASSRANLNCMRIEIAENGNQDKFRHQEGTMKAKGGSSARSGGELDTHPSPQVGTSGADEPSVSVQSFSINKCKAPGQLNPQASIHCSDPVEYPSSETPGSSKPEQMRCDLLNPASHSAAAFQEMTLSESEDVIRSAPSVSANVQVERPPDIPAVPTNTQSPSAGLLEGRAAQRGPQTRGHGGTPGLPDNRAQRPVQNPEAREAKDQCMEGDDGGMGGEVKTDEEPGQRGRADACLQHPRRPQGEEIPANMDSLKTQWLSERHLSTTHSGMSGYPQRGPQRAPNAPDNLDLPAPRSQTSNSGPPLPPLETNRLCFSQHWESSAARDLRPQKICSYADLMKTQGPAEDTQKALSQIDSSPQTLSKRDGIAPCVQTRNAAISSTSGSHIITSPEVKPSHSADPHRVSCSAHVSRDVVGLTWGPQESNGNTLDDNTPPPSKPCTYLETAHYLEAPGEYASQGGTFGRSDTTDKYQSFFFSGQMHGFPAAEGLGAGVRAVPSCQGYAEDTSSSDDEGKLIIEL